MMKLIYKGLKCLKEEGVKITFAKTVSKLLGGSFVPTPRSYNSVIVDNDDKSQGVNFIAKHSVNGFHSMFQSDILINEEPNVKVLSFYLPQFHEIPENNKWWGDGFTEWTNTKKARPLFDQHYQPRTPHPDLGYYDLSLVENIKKQAFLAKNHGIYGFCVYYYWFSGRKLLSKPLELVIKHPEIDINFCLCWANENWTRTWSGNHQDVLISQKYLENDPENFIKDIRPYLLDKRYIRYKNKPVLVVYNFKQIPNPSRVIKRWKDAANQLGIGEISIWMCRSFGVTAEELGITDLIDKEIEFPPHNMSYPEIISPLSSSQGNVYDYSLLVDKIMRERELEAKNDSLCRTVMLGWDNSPRRAERYNVFTNFDLRKYYQWLRANIEECKFDYNKEDRFTFINAWNEWGEGTYLEPDEKFGYATLNITSQAILSRDFYCVKNFTKTPLIVSGIAIQIHVFWIDLLDEVIGYLNNINSPFDCYVSTDSFEKAEVIFSKFKESCHCNHFEVRVFENKGRDIAPFIIQMKHLANKYKYICHLHTKKSLHGNFGNEWRRYLYNELLGSTIKVNSILTCFEQNSSVGIVMPDHFRAVESHISWGSNKHFSNMFMLRIGLPRIHFDNIIDFPSGDMFWARPDAIKQVFNANLSELDFPHEKGQLDGTVMHGIERVWCLVANYNGFRSIKTSSLDLD